MSEARDPATNRIDAESGESVKSCAAKAMGQAAAHHGVPMGFLAKDWNHRYAPKRVKFCHWMKCHEWFMPDSGAQVYCSPECKRAAFSEGRKSFRECERCSAAFIGTAKFCGMRCAKRAEWEADAEIQAKMPKILEMYGRQIGLKAISKEMGVPRTTVRKWLDIAGKREERNSAAARRASPIKRGDLVGENKIAVTRAIKEHQKKRRRQSRTTLKIRNSGLDLFDYAQKVKEADAVKRREDEFRGKGFKSRYHERYQSSKEFRLKEVLKRRLNKFVATGSGTRAGNLIGCSWVEFRNHIESQWLAWMAWDNLGQPQKGNWQIDHIIPCSWFDHENEEHLRLCWHYLNLRPLCAVENLIRSNRPKDLIETLNALPEHEMKHKLIAFALQHVAN